MLLSLISTCFIQNVFIIIIYNISVILSAGYVIQLNNNNKLKIFTVNHLILEHIRTYCMTFFNNIPLVVFVCQV